VTFTNKYNLALPSSTLNMYLGYLKDRGEIKNVARGVYTKANCPAS